MRVISNLIRIVKFKINPELNRPREVGLLVTENCCLRCQTCTFWRSKHDDLPLDKISYIIDQCADFGVLSMCTTGGEPALRKDLFRIADYIKNKGLSASIVTNAWFYTPEMDKHYDAINISIDGVDAETHDRIRGVKGSFNKCIKALETSKKITTINFTVQRDNYMQIEDVYKLAEKYGVFLTPFFYCEGGRLGQPVDHSLRAGSGIEKSIEVIRKYDPTLYYYTDLCLRKLNGENKPQKCIVPHMKFMIDSQGNVLPCSHFNEPIGNIFEKDLETIWMESRQLRKDIREGRCEWCRTCYSMENMMNYIMNFGTYINLLSKRARTMLLKRK